MSGNFKTQSTLHCAVIMDGNGRWATERGLPRLEGHLAGADALRRTVEAAVTLPIDTLTLYAFSSDNWLRPADEVAALMRLFVQYLEEETTRCTEEGVRLAVIGRRDRFEHDVVRAIEQAEKATEEGENLLLRLGIDYSARDAIVAAAAAAPRTREEFGVALAGAIHSPLVRDVDLLIRTGREKRLSDFLLWECAYAELFFLDCMWPEFTAANLRDCVATFRNRERRFGALPAVAQEVAHA